MFDWHQGGGGQRASRKNRAPERARWQRNSTTAPAPLRKCPPSYGTDEREVMGLCREVKMTTTFVEMASRRIIPLG